MAGRVQIDKTYSSLKKSEEDFIAALDAFCHEYALMINPKLPHKIGRSTLERAAGKVVSKYFDGGDPS